MRRTRYGVKYVCTKCNVQGVKLWREYQAFADFKTLYCVSCAEKSPLANKKKCKLNYPRIGEGGDYETGKYYSDQIGWLVPAVPDGDMLAFYGYTSVPPDRVQWWQSLPLTKEPVPAPVATPAPTAPVPAQ